MNISASEFVKQYCHESGITEREFYETQVPMPDPTSPHGWAAVSNNPLSIKAHVDLYSGKPPEPDMEKDKLRVHGINMAMSLITSTPAEPEFADGIQLCLKCMCAVKTLILEKYIPEPVLVNTDWEACRAAMLEQQLVDRVDEKSLTRINPAPDLVSLQKKAESIIGNYPGIPDCWCRTCRPVVLNDMHFVVCPDCGNKRCPRANDHRNACTGSNEPGQEGSAYPDTLHESKPWQRECDSTALSC